MEEQIIKQVFSKQHRLEELLNGGLATPEILRSWLVQRYQFEVTMLKKDLVVLSKCPDQQFRQQWIQRVIDSDSVGGGLDGWVKMGIAMGVDVTNESLVLPGVRFALDAFLAWCGSTDWRVVVSGSLSQLQATNNHRNKFDTWPELYPWIEPGGLEYFIVRHHQAGADSAKCLDFIRTINLPKEQLLESANIKRNVMRCLLDAVWLDTQK
jgi:pyrroloquinoline-quinone synthase